MSQNIEILEGYIFQELNNTNQNNRYKIGDIIENKLYDAIHNKICLYEIPQLANIDSLNSKNPKFFKIKILDEIYVNKYSGIMYTLKFEIIKEFDPKEWDLLIKDKLEEENLILKNAKYDINITECISDKLINDRNFILKLVKRNGWTLISLPDKYKKDKEIFIEAVKNQPDVFHYVDSKEMNQNKEVMLEIVKIRGINLYLASSLIYTDKDVRAKAAKYHDVDRLFPLKSSEI